MRLLLGNFKGPEGKQGPEGKKGNTGDTGQRGSRCTSGTSVTGTNTTGTKFASTGITDALIHDYYMNTDTGNLYECTVPGPADVAEWTYICNIKGPIGATGPAGSISDINNQKPTYTESTSLANIESGETVKTAFGKLKKALSLLITHYTQKATASVLGHVKLSNSAAVTQTGQMALDAIEKNASVAGTLANQIQQTNSKLTDKVTCTVSTSYITPRLLSIVPYGKILRTSIDATVTDNTTGWHTIMSGLPKVRENQHYQVLLINTNGDIGIRDGLFTNTVLNVYLESFDIGSRIIVNAMTHIV